MKDAPIPVPPVLSCQCQGLITGVLLACAAIGQALPAQSPSADPAPQVAQTKATTKPTSPTAAQRLAAATLRAAKENKRVLVLEGPLDSEAGMALQAILKRDRKLSRTMLYEYELTTRSTKGVLELLILDPKSTEVARKAAEAFQSEDRIVTKKLDAWLQEHKATPLDARKVLASALAFAKEHNKNVFVHLGAPW